MLLYHPAFDAYHCMFRSLMLLRRAGDTWIERDKLRIMDFYLLFPKEIATIRLPLIFRKAKQQFEHFPQYETISNPASVFFQLEGVFSSTTQALATFGVIEHKLDDVERMRIVAASIPLSLAERLAEKERSMAIVIEFLFTHIAPYPLYGKGGLKDRTSLLPSRYDRR